ncbi:aminopeptidase N [Neomicrococcus lactis]|uniref:aminopeptidase N n=1 Tax=Neomicrococcus lactis TaxID=732241 RepID=UPI00230146F7|nr:aminopeptidase N [Neomicrococcus lactis]
MPGLNLTREEARERAEHISVDSYEVSLDLTRGERIFGSTTTVRFSARAGASTFIDAVTDKVHRITVNGTEIDPEQNSDGVRIQLPELAAENVVTIEADALYTNTGEGLHRFVDPVDQEVYLYTQFEVPDSRRMFAVFEQPDLKATFQFTVTAPAHWDLISNQTTPEPVAVDDTKKTWTFAPTPRLASYVTALIAGPYQSIRSELTSSDGRVIPLGVFARKSLMEFVDADNIFTITRQGFEFFEKQFGTPYPFEKYDQLFVPEFNAGAMENAGAVTFLESYVFRSKVPDALVERRAITILHELAHMWFGDLVTMKWWNDLWLNESFAEFMSTLAAAEATEFTQSWTTFSSLEKSWAYAQDQLPSTHPIVAPINDLEDVQVNFDGITYAKGASVLRQLVAWVGQEEFMAGVRSYFAKHAWKNTELKDLLSELEVSSGRDLSNWGAQWLETAGVNKLEPRIEEDAEGKISSFTIRQSAPENHNTLRPHRLAVGTYDLDASGKLTRTHRVELDLDGEDTTVVELEGIERPALILVNDDDLAYAKIRLDEKSLAFAVDHLKDFESSLPRTIIWGAAWDATRDAETPARQYVELVLNNIGNESDSTVIMVLLRQLGTTLDSYVADDVRKELSERAADRLWELSQQAQPGSDAQLQFVKAFALRSRTTSQLDTVEALLNGTQELDGMSLDVDMKWALLTALVAGGRKGQADIDAMLATDDTANGDLSAHTARAALPTLEAKRAMFEEIRSGEKLSNAQSRAAIMGFNRAHDSQLLAGFAEEYFGSIRKVWESKSFDTAEQIVLGLFPVTQVAQSTLASADEFLKNLGDEIPALRRLVLESRDGIARALTARAADH